MPPSVKDSSVTSIEPKMSATPASLLSFTRVTVMRGDRAGLEDVTLEIASGEHICILGPNGCGEAKRTLIARALVHDPRTLLFDEPSNTLDIAAQLQLRDTMRALAQSGLGILLVTHHVSEIIPEIERIVLLREGRILADGPKHAVLNEEQLSRLFGAAVRLHQHDGYFHLY